MIPMEDQQLTIRSIACHWLLTQLSIIHAESEGAIQQKDIEHIHRMRVASRRARAIYRIFQEDFPPNKRDAWNKQLRSLTRALGNARDTDVQIEYLDSLILHAPQNTIPGIKRVRLRLWQYRESLQLEVIKAIHRFIKGNIIEDVQAAIGTSPLIEAPISYPSSLYQKSETAIHMGIANVIQWHSSILEPNNINELHQTRIAIKWLRYTIEIFLPIYNVNFQPYLKVLKDLQDTLGIIHDCDVWENQIQTFIVEEKALSAKFYGSEQPFQFLLPGIHFISENRRNKRGKLYTEFIYEWQRLMKNNYWQSLREVLY